METQVVYKDLFLTERYFIKGTVYPINGRLSNYLDRLTRRFIRIQDALIIDLEDGTHTSVPSMQLNADEILFAHELVESGGDVFRKHERPEFDLDHIKVVLNGAQSVTLLGKVRPESVDSSAFSQRFSVLLDPQMENLPEALRCEVDLLGSLNYLIINKQRIGYLFRD